MAKAKAKKVKVFFLKAPSARYGLAYNAGESGTVDAELAALMIEDEYAEKYEASKHRPNAK